MAVFEDISVLVTHYNRSKSLEKLLQALNRLDLNFHELIVSDDGSKPEHLSYVENLQKRYPFKLIKSPENKGLGNNINKGQKVVKTPYTLYIQEDFVPQPSFVEKLAKAHEFMQHDLSLDFVRFYAYFKFPNLTPVSDGFSEMHFSHAKFWQGYRKFYVYSDHPHLRRQNFFDRFGEYQEGIKPDRTEYNMMMQVLAGKPKAYFYNDINTLLAQENSAEEPSTIKRNILRNSNHFFSVIARMIYRYIRFNLELFIFKIKRKTNGRSLI
ncbi:MAG TPA: glycosyltransferase family 2 protein [Pelobium sp.]|nr:glycosyltransferase family 2 protein [Pelobium sp.]